MDEEGITRGEIVAGLLLWRERGRESERGKKTELRFKGVQRVVLSEKEGKIVPC